MNENKTILIIILVSILLLYVTGIVYLIVRYVVPTGKNNVEGNSSEAGHSTSLMDDIGCELKSPQTEFFKKSARHAEKILMGNVFLDGYKYGGAVDLTKLDDNTKRSIIITMKYMMIDPIGSKNIEERFGIIRDQENVPMWFVILHQAINKLIPSEDSRSQYQPINYNSEGATIIPINRVA